MEDVSAKRGRNFALDGVSLTLHPGKSLAVVGESGAGKSTLIATILGLLRTVSGTITWNNAPVPDCRPALVMQEPRAAFNPALSLRRSVLEPILARGDAVPNDRLSRLCRGLEIPTDLLDRRPTQVSIGQAQRMGILRALISAPPLVLFDEPLSALDAVTQKHTARLITDLRQTEGFAALIVTHDLGYAVAHADEIAVLKAGRIVEIAKSRDFARAPVSDYGQMLRSAAIALGALEMVA